MTEVQNPKGDRSQALGQHLYLFYVLRSFPSLLMILLPCPVCIWSIGTESYQDWISQRGTMITQNFRLQDLCLLMLCRSWLGSAWKPLLQKDRISMTASGQDLEGHVFWRFEISWMAIYSHLLSCTQHIVYKDNNQFLTILAFIGVGRLAGRQKICLLAWWQTCRLWFNAQGIVSSIPELENRYTISIGC